MRYSILHLSDLHRDLTDEIPSAWLIDSIERDLHAVSHENPAPPHPSLCVVSGDLVYGVSPTVVDADRELERQTVQALEFLTGLADRLFAGDRNKVVILPGNHDVSYKKVRESCAIVPMPTDMRDRAGLVREYFTANSSLRWSWSELAFYRIVDVNEYASRLSSFAGLYSEFYQGHRQYSLLPESQFEFFDFPDQKLSLLALNSCYGNDPFQRAGRMHPGALTEATRQLRSASRSGWLLASAWHHNLTGGPAQDDYLDPSFLQLLIDSGVSLGLHGHQHRTEWFDERYRLGPNARKMVITSAATLCAGPTNLSPGSPRGYNLVEIDNEHWTARLHQRQMVNLQFNMPVWGPGHFVDTNQSFVEFELSPPLVARPARLDLQLVLEAADVLLGKANWTQVLTTLAGHLEDPFARMMATKALEELDDANMTIKVLTEPRSNAEAVLLGSAVLASGDAGAYARFLADPFVVASNDASVGQMASSIRMKASK
jgi:3',5'-cyclic AMP phosphodiesterase CpdA